MLGDSGDSAIVPFSTYEEVFNTHFPFYLSIGMTYDEYWNMDCLLVKSYRKANNLRRDRVNQEMWLQGMYIYDSIIRIAPILQAFAKGGTKPMPYVEKPYDLTPEAIEKTKADKEKEAYMRMKQRMETFTSEHNKQFEDKGGEKDADRY